jgi:hypothetical protein
MTTAGVLTEFAIPTSGAGVPGVATGLDGNVWFTENTANQLAIITPAGEIQEFPIPTASSLPRRPTAGPDGNVWFPEGVGKIGRSAASCAGAHQLVEPAGPPAHLAGAAPPLVPERSRAVADRHALGTRADLESALSVTQRIASSGNNASQRLSRTGHPGATDRQ